MTTATPREPSPKQHEVIAELNNRWGVERWDVQEDGTCEIKMEPDSPYDLIVIDQNGDLA